MRHFSAPWDATLRATTIGATLLMIAAALTTAWLPSLAHGAPPPAVRLFGLVTIAVLVGCWALAPARYALVAGQVRIHRRGAPPIAIPIDTITEVARVDHLDGVIRVFGSGGLFGYFGRYRTGAFGSVRMYATRRRDFVVLRSAAAVWVITPGPSDAFVAALRADAPQVRDASSGEARVR